MRDVMKESLAMYGLEARTAPNGEHALEMIQEEQPAAVLLDLMMPVMDGFTVLAELDRRGLVGAFPVIVVSAVADVSGVGSLRGTFAVLQKGRIDPATIARTLQAAGITLPSAA
jgi:CheY-like chemotaxis protein